jgi:hypothetical protein
MFSVKKQLDRNRRNFFIMSSSYSNIVFRKGSDKWMESRKVAKKNTKGAKESLSFASLCAFA